MRSNYKKIGQYIRVVDVRNIADKKDNLLGVSVSKVFIKSIANTVGTDFTNYKVVKKNQFTYIPDTSRRGDKIGIALLENEEEGLVSQAYTVFEISDTDSLLPEYLMMWFRRPEFDRYARFISHGSVREIFSWEDMCNVELPVPSINKQKEIVKEYNVLVDRINLNNRLIHKLEETAQAIYKHWFVDFEFPGESGNSFKSNGGEMGFNKELDQEIPRDWQVVALKSICTKIGSGATPRGGKDSYHTIGTPLIRSQNVHDFIFSSEDIAFIDEKQAKELKNVIVEEDDILLNITGVSVARCCKVPEFIVPARVNQHVMIIRPDKRYFMSHYLLCFLCYSDNKSKLLGISQSGSTREAITKSEVEDFQILLPKHEIVKCFDKKLHVIMEILEKKVLQNEKLLQINNLLLSKLATLGG